MFGQVSEQKTLFDYLDAYLRRDLSAAVVAGDTNKEVTITKQRDLLARSFFVLLFGQFEREVNRKFDTELAKRSSNPDWTQRRGWDAASLQGSRVPFETRLAMVLDKKTSAFGKIESTYGKRNHCAHGGTSEEVGSIDALVQDIYIWYAQLR